MWVEEAHLKISNDLACCVDLHVLVADAALHNRPGGLGTSVSCALSVEPYYWQKIEWC